MLSLRGEVKVSPSLRFGCIGVFGGKVGLCAVWSPGVWFCGDVSAPRGLSSVKIRTEGIAPRQGR